MTARFSALLLALTLAGLLAGTQMGGLTNAQYAQTGGTSSSGAGGAGGSSGSSGSNADGTSGTSGQDGTSGTSEADGSSGASGTGGGGTGGGGTGGTTPGGTTPGGTGGTGTTAPGGVAIPQPTSPTSVPESRVGEGLPTSCPGSAGGNVRCFDIGDDEGVDAVRIPDGAGGFVIVPILAPVPVVDVDTGTSTSAASNIDNRIQVNVQTGDVIRVERRIDERRQSAFATLAALLLAVTGAASIASYLHIRKLGR